MPVSKKKRAATRQHDALANSIIRFYETFDEATRLGRDIGPLEFERTKEVFQRFLPKPPAVICDIGGGPGHYSFWLAELGYTVDLVDLVPRHVQQAKEHNDKLKVYRLRSIKVGDARKLRFPERHADAVILHGPLYHQIDLRDRLAALRESRRILKKSGVLLAVAISRYAGAIAGLLTDRVWKPDFIESCRVEITSGIRRVSSEAVRQRKVKPINTAYFHLPDEFSNEIKSAGLMVDALVGIIGPSWMVPDLEASWTDPGRRSVILELARLFEKEPILGPRILAVCHPGIEPRSVPRIAN
jgi:ubiquinone/menaquinone biosynthesis C-methylase UbiE